MSLLIIRQTCWASEMAWAVAAAALLGGAMCAASTAASVTGALAAVALLFIFIFFLLIFEDFLGRFLIGVKSLEDRSFFSFSSGDPAADLMRKEMQMCSIGLSQGVSCKYISWRPVPWEFPSGLDVICHPLVGHPWWISLSALPPSCSETPTQDIN